MLTRIEIVDFVTLKFGKYDENWEGNTAGFIEAPAFAPRERVRTKTVSPTLIIIIIITMVPSITT